MAAPLTQPEEVVRPHLGPRLRLVEQDPVKDVETVFPDQLSDGDIFRGLTLEEEFSFKVSSIGDNGTLKGVFIRYSEVKERTVLVSSGVTMKRHEQLVHIENGVEYEATLKANDRVQAGRKAIFRLKLDTGKHSAYREFLTDRVVDTQIIPNQNHRGAEVFNIEDEIAARKTGFTAIAGS